MKGQTLQFTLQIRSMMSRALVRNWDLWRAAAYEQCPVTSVFLIFEYAHVSWALGEFCYESQSQEYLQRISPSCCEIWSFYFVDLSSLRVSGVFLRSLLPARLQMVSWVCKIWLFSQNNVSCPKQIVNILVFILLGLKTEDVPLLKKGTNN